VNIDDYKQRLLELEKDLSTRTRREAASARDQSPDGPGDAGDASASDETASESFSEAQLSSDILKEVRDALIRVDDGSFGKCIVDGEPINPKRLEAVPWTRYCLKHQGEIDAEADLKLPTM
jgi:DnaK suppressor protein